MERENSASVSGSSLSTPTKHRSPAYPSFSLRTAVAKARIFYDAQKRNNVHVSIASETLGYKIKSGAGLRAIAALISFGLMEETGSGESRQVKLTLLAIRILRLEEEDPDRLEAIREAARKPRIYTEMLHRWPDGLPSNSAMSKHLTFDRNFNPEIVNLLVRDFKDTYDYAHLAEQSTSNLAGEDQNEEITNADEENDMEDSLFNIPSVTNVVRPAAAIVQQETQARVLSIPITGGRTAFLNIPQDISENDLDFLQTYLRLMKDAIVTRHVSNNDKSSEPN